MPLGYDRNGGEAPRERGFFLFCELEVCFFLPKSRTESVFQIACAVWLQVKEPAKVLYACNGFTGGDMTAGYVECLAIGHGGPGGPLSQMSPTIDARMPLEKRICMATHAGAALTEEEASKKIDGIRLVAIELSEFSKKGGKPQECERLALALAADRAVPCVLVVCGTLKPGEVPYLQQRELADAVRLVVFTPRSDSTIEHETMSQFPNCVRVMRYSPHMVRYIVENMKRLADGRSLYDD